MWGPQKETWRSKSIAGAEHTLTVSLPCRCEVSFSPATYFLDAWGGISELQMAFYLFVGDYLAILTNFLVYENVSVRRRTYGFPVRLAKKYSSTIACSKMNNTL